MVTRVHPALFSVYSSIQNAGRRRLLCMRKPSVMAVSPLPEVGDSDVEDSDVVLPQEVVLPPHAEPEEMVPQWNCL